MCSGTPFNPFGYSIGQGYNNYQQQMMGQMGGMYGMQGMGTIYGMQGTGNWGPGSGATINPQTGASWSSKPQKTKPKKKRCVCAYCGRPMRMDQDETCKGCGAWEVEFK